MRITYIGHATLLIEIGGLRILTDPNFDDALGGVLRRVSAPGIALAALPKLDLILLTHAHADHLSFQSLRALEQVPIYTPPPVARWLRRLGFSTAISVAPSDSVTVHGVTITVAEATHRGHRYGLDRWRGTTNMYLVSTNSKSVFFVGDTGIPNSSQSLIRDQLWNQDRLLDVALLPIGYAPKWKLGFRKGHLDSQAALWLFDHLKARRFIPYHWGTFHHVTASAYDAINELRAHLPNHSRSSDVTILEPGEAYEDVE